MATVLLSTSVFAAEPFLGWKTPMGAGRTAVDAARRIFPGATMETGDTLVLADDKVLRLLGTSKKRALLEASATLSAPYSLEVRSEGRAWTLLLWEGTNPGLLDEGGFGDRVAVLAVFRDGDVEPIDVAEVKVDRETGFGGTFPLGADQGFTVVNTHHNSSQGYLITDVLHLRGGRLRRVTSLFTLSANAGCADSFDESPDLRTEADGDNLPRIVISVELVHAPEGLTDDCHPRPKPRRETFEDRFRWDASKDRYVLEGGTISRLDAFNEKNL